MARHRKAMANVLNSRDGCCKVLGSSTWNYHIKIKSIKNRCRSSLGPIPVKTSVRAVGPLPDEADFQLSRYEWLGFWLMICFLNIISQFKIYILVIRIPSLERVTATYPRNPGSNQAGLRKGSSIRL